MHPVYKSDIGTVLELTIYDEDGAVINVGSATTKTIKLKKPSGIVVSKTASFTTNGSDGKIRYTTILNDLDESGDYQMQGYIEIGSSVKYHTSEVIFSALPAFS